MNVKDLIAELQKCDPDMMVVVYGYGGGVNEVRLVEGIGVKLNANTKWYYGKHEKTCCDEKPDAIVVKLS
jgi:hypothetical protein